MRHRYDKSKRKRSYTKTVTKMIGSEIVEGIETGVVSLRGISKITQYSNGNIVATVENISKGDVNFGRKRLAR